MLRVVQSAAIAIILTSPTKGRADTLLLSDFHKQAAKVGERIATSSEKLGFQSAQTGRVLYRNIGKAWKSVDFAQEVQQRAQIERISYPEAFAEVTVATAGGAAVGTVVGGLVTAGVGSVAPPAAPVAGAVAGQKVASETKSLILDQLAAQRFDARYQESTRALREQAIRQALLDPAAQRRVHARVVEEQRAEFVKLMGDPIRPPTQPAPIVPSPTIPQAPRSPPQGIGPPATPPGGAAPKPATPVPPSEAMPRQSQPVPSAPLAPSGGVRNSAGQLPEVGTRIGAFAPDRQADGVRSGGVAQPPKPPASGAGHVASPAPQSSPNAGARTEVRDIGADRRIGAYESSTPRNPVSGQNQAEANRPPETPSAGVRTGAQQPNERRIGAFADDPAFQRLKDEFKRPDMNLRATAQTGTAPQVATRMQSGMPEAYRQELAERERQRREEQERIRRENEAARRAALEDGWRRMNEAQRNANPNADPNNRCRIDYHHVGELPKECESTASKPQTQGRYSRWKTVDFFTNFANYPMSEQMGVCNLEFDNNDLYSFAKEYVDSFVPSIQAGQMQFRGQGGDRMNNYYFEVGRTGLANIGQAAPYVTEQIRVTRRSNRQVVRQYFGSGIEIRQTYERCDP